MSDVSQIDGSAIRLKRETQGWAIADLASRACLSVKQIRQIEEGGMTAFYSESVKLTAARKVAGLLQMSETQLFGQQLPAVVHQDEETLLHTSAYVQSPPLNTHFEAAPAANPITRSEALHVLAQPPEHVPEHVSEDLEEASEPAPNSAEPLADTTPNTIPAPADEAQPAGSGYLLKIVALFLVALAAAALLRPKVMDEKVDAAVEAPAPAAAMNPGTGTPATDAAPVETTPPAANSAPPAAVPTVPNAAEPPPAANAAAKPASNPPSAAAVQ